MRAFFSILVRRLRLPFKSALKKTTASWRLQKSSALAVLVFALLALVVTFNSTVLVPSAQAAAGTNQQINFQGKLVNPDGTNVADGTYNLQFKIYQDGDGVLGGGDETLKWTETRLRNNTQGVIVSNGIFQVNLGSVNAFGSSIDWNQDTLWLSMQVGGTNATCTPFSTCAGAEAEMNPFIRFTSTPYALNSAKLQGLDKTGFVQLAQGLQTDASTTNASIAINKTGGTANILDLQRGGASVQLIANDGSTIFQNQTNSTAGFKIQSATSGVQTLFTADTTNNKIKIGDSTGTDTATTLLQVDSATANPTTLTGRNGGLFYDSTLDQLKVVEAGAVARVCTTTAVCAGYAPSAGNGYVQLAPSSVQVDSSTNNSIFVNKTGASGNIVELQKGGVDKFVIDSSGNVGIGTTGPTATLHVVAPNQVTAQTAAAQALQVTGGQGGSAGAAQTGGTGSAINLTGGQGGGATSATGTPGQGGSLTIQAGNGGNGTSTSGNGSGGNIVLQSGSPGSGGSGAVGNFGTISLQQSGGSVGIGNSNPSAVLHVTAPNGISGGTGTAGTAGLIVTGGNGGNSSTSSTAGASGGAISLTAGNGGNSTGVAGTNGANITLQAGAGGTGATTGGYGNIVLNSSGGNVGIGTGSTPAKLLSVGGTTGNVTIDASGNVVLGASSGSGTTITNNGATVNSTLALTDFTTGGSIGTAANTVDKYTSISIAQLTASQTLTIPAPTANTTYGRVVYVSNVGNVSFNFSNTLLTAALNPGATATLIWSNANGGAGWSYAGADGSAILNQNTTNQTANFRISGTGQANTSFLTPLLDAAASATALNIGTTNANAINLNQNTTIAAAKTFTVTSALTSLTGATSGDALNVSNSTSSGNIAVFKSNATAVATIGSNGNVSLNPLAAASGTPTIFNLNATAANHTGLTNAEAIDANFNLARTVTFTGGAATSFATQRALVVQAPTFAATTGTLTITDAATQAITGAPVKGTNVAITNSHALLIQSGAAGAATNSYGLTVNAQTGATNNYAAEFLGGNVGIGIANPTAALHVVAPNGTSGGVGTAGTAGLIVTGGNGGNSATASTAGGTGGAISLTSGSGGNSTGVAGTNGANITVQGGAGGTGSATGTYGNILLNSAGGNVGIGTASPNNARLSFGTQVNVPLINFFDGGSAARYGYGIQANELQSFVPTTSHFSFNAGGDLQASGTNELLRIQGDGKVGIGTVSPTAILHVVAPQPTTVAGAGASATQVLQVTGGKGGNTTGTTTTAGAGSSSDITAGAGGNATDATANTASAGTGGNLTFSAGAGGTNSSTGNRNGAVAGGITFTGGAGGNATGSGNNSNGGSITLQGGAAGTGGSGTTGSRGSLILQPSGGNVGIGNASPGEALDVTGNISGSNKAYIQSASGAGGQGYYVRNASLNNLAAFQALDLGGNTYAFFDTNKHYDAVSGWVDNGLSRTGSSFQIQNDSFTFYSFDTSNNFTNRLQVASGGNVGIGTNNLTPSSTLQVLNNTGAANALQIQNSLGANAVAVETNSAVNLALNSGGETGGTPPTSWAAHGAATVTQDSTAGEFSSGAAGIKAATTGTSQGARNNVGTVIAASSSYVVSFSIKASVALTNANVTVRFSPDGTGSNNADCSTYTASYNPSISTSNFIKYTCTLTTAATTTTSSAYLAIFQADATSRSIFIDNLSIVLQNSSGTQNVNTLRVGGASSQGLTLLTLDTSAGTPFTGTNTALVGSMYFDTTSGKIQCYDGSVWGACGAAPNGIVTITPEYAGAVLNGTGIGTLTSDFCGNGGGLSVNVGLCASGEARNFYKWTSIQPSAQTYSMYVTYKLPSTFKNFVDNNTISLTARTDNTTNGIVAYELYKSTGSTITACGTSTTVTSSINTWQTVSHNGNENSTCAFAANNYVIFKITMTASNSASVLVENLNFSYTNQ